MYREQAKNKMEAYQKTNFISGFVLVAAAAAAVNTKHISLEKLLQMVQTSQRF